MEILKQLKELADKVENLKDKIKTEESTKHAFTLPFLTILGYDTFNPTEVVPEYEADIGMKKGEKVDYAIIQNNQPILIIECKHWEENLNIHTSQLIRYFNTTNTRFALLTNGIQYRFYTELEEKNKLDNEPFLEFDLTNIKENIAKELEKFHKSNFDASLIFDNASNLKNARLIKQEISQELEKPSQDFVRHFAGKVYKGNLTEKVLDSFTDIVNKAFNQIINERVNDRLNLAIKSEMATQTAQEQQEEILINKIETTKEELEAFQIVVAILRRKVPKSRISYKDTQSYFKIILDNKIQKPICILHLNSATKSITLFDKEKHVPKEKIETIDEIYKFEDQLLGTIDIYDTE